MIYANLAVNVPQGFFYRAKNMGSASSPEPMWLDTGVTMNESKRNDEQPRQVFFFSHDFSALSITVVKNDTLSFGS
ncbi:hypothetical protein [Bacillus amyloliquefaciens]|uniref:Uncharacterized protein n=1 Tax=Bacillus amyloliquefaciens TaxID=1390 RepID=A0AAP7N4R5_BACAM|nr:hypothetical protein [Bacillus amyloliquefaciens]OIK20011.1 hypothetical protein BKP66_16940 [Bacillus amyloliquefaciens]